VFVGNGGEVGVCVEVGGTGVGVAVAVGSGVGVLVRNDVSVDVGSDVTVGDGVTGEVQVVKKRTVSRATRNCRWSISSPLTSSAGLPNDKGYLPQKLYQ
jgi:hypothetical protein